MKEEERKEVVERCNLEICRKNSDICAENPCSKFPEIVSCQYTCDRAEEIIKEITNRRLEPLNVLFVKLHGRLLKTAHIKGIPGIIYMDRTGLPDDENLYILDNKFFIYTRIPYFDTEKEFCFQMA